MADSQLGSSVNPMTSGFPRAASCRFPPMSSAVGSVACRSSKRRAAPKAVLRQDRRVDAGRDPAQLVKDANLWPRGR
jgi:hypothetical protein